MAALTLNFIFDHLSFYYSYFVVFFHFVAKTHLLKEKEKKIMVLIFTPSRTLVKSSYCTPPEEKKNKTLYISHDIIIYQNCYAFQKEIFFSSY